MAGAPAQATSQSPTPAHWTSQSAVQRTRHEDRFVQSTVLSAATVASQVDTEAQRTLLPGPVPTRQLEMSEQSYWHPAPQRTSQRLAREQIGTHRSVSRQSSTQALPSEQGQGTPGSQPWSSSSQEGLSAASRASDPTQTRRREGRTTRRTLAEIR